MAVITECNVFSYLVCMQALCLFNLQYIVENMKVGDRKLS